MSHRIEIIYIGLKTTGAGYKGSKTSRKLNQRLWDQLDPGLEWMTQLSASLSNNYGGLLCHVIFYSLFKNTIGDMCHSFDPFYKNKC